MLCVSASPPALLAALMRLQTMLPCCMIGAFSGMMPVRLGGGGGCLSALPNMCRNPGLMNPRGSRQVGPGAITMMAYPMQRMSAFQQQGAQPQFFGLCLRVAPPPFACGTCATLCGCSDTSCSMQCLSACCYIPNHLLLLVWRKATHCSAVLEQFVQADCD